MRTSTTRRPSLASLLGALLVSLLLAGAAVTVLLPRLARPAGDGMLAPIAPAPSFTLTDQLGRTLSDAELRGKVVVANFIYTTCTDICPALTAQMASLRTRLADEGLLGNDVVLLSISVDPARDTPGVLKAYSEPFAADPASWHFLTGDEAAIWEVVVDGFMLGIEVMEAAAQDTASHNTGAGQSGNHGAGHSGSHEVMHSGRFVVIDRDWQIRAYHDSAELDQAALLRQLRAFATDS